MKRKIFLLGVTISLASAAAFSQDKDKFTIKGSIENIADPVQKVYLTYRAGSERRMDSAEIKDGKYTLSNTIAEPVRATLQVKYAAGADGKPKPAVGKRDVASIFLSPSTIKITSTDSFSNVKVKGSDAHKAYEKLDQQLKPSNNKMMAWSKQWSETKDEAKRKRLEEEYDVIDNEMKQAYKQYVKDNPKSPVALYATIQYAGYDLNADSSQPIFDLLPASTKALPSATEFADRLEIARKLAIGKPALEFTQNDTLGKPVALSSLRGKVLLVDFWASWCGPCRRDNPNVVKLFNQYKDKDFSVLGVSLDQPGAKERWMKAIHDDKLTWTHVSDLKWWDNDVAKLYGVRAIPFNLLLDKNGNIIGRNLHGEELEKKLSQVLQ
jgi:peroxiredoxin